jgi:hypothetical protein
MKWTVNDLRNRLPGARRPGATTLVGLAFDGARVEGVEVRRTNGSAELRNAFSIRLSADPATAEPAVWGRELRQHLEAAGIRERRCVVGLPLAWVLPLTVPLPDLPEDDLESLLQLEAERGFPSSPETLIVARSRYRTAGGAGCATLLGVSRALVARLETALRAAQLTPVSFTLGIAELPGATGSDADGVLTLVPGAEAVSLMVTTGGGVALLRSVATLSESAEGTTTIPADQLARELRITLGQLPPELGDAITCIRVFGAGEDAERLVRSLEGRFGGAHLRIERVTQLPPEGLGVGLPAGLPVSLAGTLAVRRVARSTPAFEFLPPKVSPWRQMTEKYASRRLAWVGAAALGLALLGVLAFSFQQVQLWYWRSRWNAIRQPVAEATAVEQRVRQFGPWFDDSFRSLSILRRLTEAFPEEGTVSAKSVDIRPANGVTCTGTARDNQSLLRMGDRLRAMPEVGAVKFEQIRGSTPIQFTVNFQWRPTAKP